MVGPGYPATTFFTLSTAVAETRASLHRLDLITPAASLIPTLIHPHFLSSSDQVFTQAGS